MQDMTPGPSTSQTTWFRLLSPVRSKPAAVDCASSESSSESGQVNGRMLPNASVDVTSFLFHNRDLLYMFMVAVGLLIASVIISVIAIIMVRHQRAASEAARPLSFIAPAGSSVREATMLQHPQHVRVSPSKLMVYVNDTQRQLKLDDGPLFLAAPPSAVGTDQPPASLTPLKTLPLETDEEVQFNLAAFTKLLQAKIYEYRSERNCTPPSVGPGVSSTVPPDASADGSSAGRARSGSSSGSVPHPSSRLWSFNRTPRPSSTVSPSPKTSYVATTATPPRPNVFQHMVNMNMGRAVHGRWPRAAVVRDTSFLNPFADYLLVNHSHIFEVMHNLWANEELNAFWHAIERPSPVYDNTTSTPTLNIFWAFDHNSLPPRTSYYAIVNITTAPRFVEISASLNEHQRITLIRNAIKDAMNEWSSALKRIVVFREIPYTRLQLDHEEFSRVVIVAFRDPVHREEHRDVSDNFNTTEIAHAAYNLLHLNTLYHYQLMPRPITTAIPVVIAANGEPELSDGVYHLFLVERSRFHSVFNVSFADLYPHIAHDQAMDSSINLAAVLIHEIGHVLGLSHYVGRYVSETSIDTDVHDGSSMMASYYNEDLTMLTPLDKLAINGLFERLRLRAQKIQSTGVF